MVNNDDWLDRLEYIPFLRDVGRHFTINRMLTFDSVRLRLDREQPLTFLEFNYMILQGYDFLELSRRQAAGCSSAGRISGAISSTASSWPADRRDRAFRRHHAADHQCRRRQDGQDRAGRGLAQCASCSALTITGSSGGTRRTPMSAGSSGCSPTSAGRHRAAGKPARRRDQRGEDRPRDRGHRDAPRPRGGRGCCADRPRDLRGGGAGEDLPTLSVGEGMNFAAGRLTALGFYASNRKRSARSPKARCAIDDAVVSDPALTVGSATSR